MPLDTQPLSRGRRAVLAGVLAALFAGSLGFAQYLVVKHKGGGEVVAVLGRVGFTQTEGTGVDGEVAIGTGVVEKRARVAMVYAWPAEGGMNRAMLQATAAELFGQITAMAPKSAAPGMVLGRVGVEMWGVGEQGQFTILRMAVVDRQVVAISYSGPLPYTDADRASFDAICSTGVELRK